MEGIRRSDTFVVSGEGFCSSVDYQVLTLMYQPIIGETAFTLYLTLMNLMDRQALVSEEYLHADLESLLNRKLSDIEQDRFKLEAIGLLVTFFASDSFTYEIKLPLSARSFVNDGVLGQYLISAITKTRFKKIVKIFKIKVPNKKQKYNVSKAFNEVFPSIGISSDIHEDNLISGEPIRFQTLNKYDFDWRLFKDSISEEFFSFDNMTEAIRNKIENLSYVYNLNELIMKDVLLKSLDEYGQVNIEMLAKNARYQYEFENSQPVKTNTKNQTKKTQIKKSNLPTDPVEYFKTVTPKQLLEEIGDGLVSVADLKIIERLIDEIGLEIGVVNVLISYIAKKKDGILPGYAYFQKVGASWKRNQVNSVETAMDYIKHLESRQKENKNKKYNPNGANDIEIDWLDDYIKSLD